MTKTEVCVVIAWFLLAAYVLYRCLTAVDVQIDLIFAAWTGGVLSTVCFEIVRRHRKE